eukprot:2238608-Rhodomonas_salina.3
MEDAQPGFGTRCRRGWRGGSARRDRRQVFISRKHRQNTANATLCEGRGYLRSRRAGRLSRRMKECAGSASPCTCGPDASGSTRLLGE